MLRCLIIDDDPLICDLLEHFCSKTDSVEYCISVHHCQDGLRLLATEDFDVIFLDFNLPDMNGRSFLERYSSGSPVVMITSDPEFAADSYNYDQVVDYMVKPLTFQRYERALERIRGIRTSHDRPQKTKDLFVKDGHSMVRIHLDEVLFIKSEANYVSFFTPEKKVMTLASLKSIEDRLGTQFQRTHRSYLVNMNKVEAINQDEIKVGNHSIPLSISYKKKLFTILNEL